MGSSESGFKLQSALAAERGTGRGKRYLVKWRHFASGEDFDMDRMEAAAGVFTEVN